jgi:pimeloyl-ACP methyl ester carboxylesterase
MTTILAKRLDARRRREREMWREHLAAMDRGQFRKAKRIERVIFGLRAPVMTSDRRELLTCPFFSTWGEDGRLRVVPNPYKEKARLRRLAVARARAVARRVARHARRRP